MDFDRSVNKLQKEQERRRLEAKRRIERERKAQEEAKKQQALIEEAIHQRKLEQAAKEEKERLRQEEELRLTAGITYKKDLLAFDIDGEGDKVTLPPSVLEELTKQDALAQGVMLLQLTLPDGRRTHAGVLEFSAEEGTVGLPMKVQRSLGKVDDSVTLGTVEVKYVRLEKGKYIKLQPRTAGLSQVPDLKPMLEMNLHKHATLTLGDVLQVWYRGKVFDIKVVEVQPEPQVTVIDTDIEVDLEVPEEQARREAEERKADEAKKLGSSPERGEAGSSSMIPTAGTAGGGGGSVLGGSGGGKALIGRAGNAGGRSFSPPMAASPRVSAEESSSAMDIEEERADSKRRAAALLAKIPPEPSVEEDGVINLLIRKPDGSMVSRRFSKTWPLSTLFDFVDAGLPQTVTYRLVTRFPRRVFTGEEGVKEKTLAEVGLTGKQETFMFEAY